MAEEDSGFTFVDKRRSQNEDGAGDDVAETAPDVSHSVAGPGGPEAAPDVYGVLGYCISLLATEAWHKLGLLADPKTGEAVADLGQAKVAIDAVGDLAVRLEAAPAESVPDVLRRDLKTLLNDLRLNYVARRGDSAGSRN